MKTENKVEAYELNGTESPMMNRPVMIVKNHWNRRQLVVIEVDGKSYTVDAEEMKRAIDNSTNAHKF